MAFGHYDYIFKFIVVGDSGVGKSSIIERLAEKSFSDAYRLTIGVDYRVTTMSIDGKIVKLQLWDTAGDERFQHITSSYYKSCDGCIIVYDINNSQSFENIQKWYDRFYHSNGAVAEDKSEYNKRVVVVGNKLDKNSYFRVLSSQGRDAAKRLGVHFMEVSAKENTNIKEVFTLLASHLKRSLDMEESYRMSDKTTGLLSQKEKKKKWWKCCMC